MINSSHIVSKFKAVGDYTITPTALTNTTVSAPELSDISITGWFIIFPSLAEERKIINQNNDTITFNSVNSIESVSEIIVSYSNFQSEITEAVRKVDLVLANKGIDKTKLNQAYLNEIYAYEALYFACLNKARDRNDDIFYQRAMAALEEARELIENIEIDINNDGIADKPFQIRFER